MKEGISASSSVSSGRPAPALSTDAIAILESIGDAFYALDQGWRFTYANSRALEFWRLTADEVLGHTIWERFPQILGSDSDEALRKARNGQPSHIETFSPVGRRWIAVSFYPAPNGVSIYFRDITARVEAEQTVRANEEHLRLAQEAAGIGTWDWNLVTGAIHWSPEMYRVLGLSPGTDDPYAAWVRALHPEDREAADTAARGHSKRPGPFNLEFRIVRPDGGVRWILSRGTVIADGAGTPVRMLGVNLDVTERKRAEAALQEGEQRLRATYERAPVGIAEADRQGRFLRVNDALCTITGHSRAEMLRLCLSQVTHPEDLERDLERYRRQWAGEIDAYTLEKRYMHKDGRPLWIMVSSSVVRDAAGQPLYAIRVTQDITDRKRAEEALAEETRSLETLNRVGALLAAELDLERLVQATTDAATELTGARFGAFFYNVTNPDGESYTLYTLSGIPREAFAGFGMPRNTAVFGPTFRGEGVVRVDDITRDPRYGRNAPHHGMPKGHPPVRSHLAVPVIARSGEVLGGMFFAHERTGVFTDRAERLASGIAAQAAIAIDNARLFHKAQEEVAERRRAEDSLRDLNESLEQRVAARTVDLEVASRRLVQEAEERRQAEAALLQAQKLEAIGQLTGGVAHDFNNLLTAVLGNLELARSRVTDERVRGQLERATQAAQRGAKLTQQLLAYARKQRLESQAVDANAVIAGMGDMLQRSLGGLVQVETDLAPDVWQASTDPTQLELVLLNLAINARDAMPPWSCHLRVMFRASRQLAPPPPLVQQCQPIRAGRERRSSSSSWRTRR